MTRYMRNINEYISYMITYMYKQINKYDYFLMCALFYFSLVRLSVCAFAIHSMYANLSLKTTIIKQNFKIILIAGVSSSQALPGFLTTAPPSMCVPDVIGALACGFQTKKKQKKIR